MRLLNPSEIQKMRTAGRLASEVLDYITPFVQPGVSTGELNRLCHEYMINVQQTIPAPLNYPGGAGQSPYPAAICTSVNDVICHGIPDFSCILKVGDTINLDITVIKDGFHGDTSRMFWVGNEADISSTAKKLCEVTYQALFKGIQAVKPGGFVGDIGFAIQQFIKPYGYSIVEDYCGHGIHEVFHTEPQILHVGIPNTGPQLHAGMTFTIEPMINLGGKKSKLMQDGWTVKTKDGQLSAQWEHTVLVTEKDCEILTLSAGYPALPSFFKISS
jgi:methionyl aminopeptidase